MLNPNHAQHLFKYIIALMRALAGGRGTVLFHCGLQLLQVQTDLLHLVKLSMQGGFRWFGGFCGDLGGF